MSDLTYAQIRTIEASPRRELCLEVERWDREHGVHVILGGPRAMSHAELVAAVCRIRRGEDPRGAR